MSTPRRPRTFRSSRGRPRWAVPAVILLLLVFAVLGLTPEDVLADIAGAARPQGGAAVTVNGVTVVDGDTIRIGGERVRVENLDTPELGDGAECLAERLLADRALDYARVLFAEASAVRIARNGQDRYGRTLAAISLDGRDFGHEMIVAGYARRWTGRRIDWCGAA